MLKHTEPTPGLIRCALGIALMFAAVGGMDNPEQAPYFLYQLSAAAMGLVLAWWGVRALDRTFEKKTKRFF